MTRVAVLTISDSVVAGTREDVSGPALTERVRRFGWQVACTRPMRDEVIEIAAAMAELSDSGTVDVILSTGGTGLTPRDVTPEAARARLHAHGRAFSWRRVHTRRRADPDLPRIASRCGRVIRSSGGVNPPRSQSVTG
jgi:molybdenum cofactor synthesis domain-containing protein